MISKAERCVIFVDAFMAARLCQYCLRGLDRFLKKLLYLSPTFVLRNEVKPILYSSKASWICPSLQPRKETNL
jgi:hypothetical protein